VLLNVLLRSYLQYNLYDQALKLISKSTFPPQASNNEWARYLFYTGRLKVCFQLIIPIVNGNNFNGE
jgi:26S proteasome regulatory subunit N3